MPGAWGGGGVCSPGVSVDKASCERCKLLDASVAQEGPPAAHVLASLHVYIHHRHLFFGLAGLVQNLSLRTGHEAAAPELYAVGLLAGVGLVAHTVDASPRFQAIYDEIRGDGGFAFVIQPSEFIVFLQCDSEIQRNSPQIG